MARRGAAERDIPMSDTQEFPAQPKDLSAEGERARALARTVEGVQGVVDGLRWVNDTILAQVLFALWDSGFYEYSLTHAHFSAAEAARQLHADPMVLDVLLNHLVGRGLLEKQDGLLSLTPRGQAITTVLVRGTFNLYLGGYGNLLSRLGPLLRGQTAITDPALQRSGWHTGVGSEQLACVRIVPAILKILQGHSGRRVIDLGCGAGGFLRQLAGQHAALRGFGIDASPEALDEARRQTHHAGMDDRLAFALAEIGRDPLPTPSDGPADGDILTAMYLFHEFGRDGEERIVNVLRDIARAYPARVLVFAECLPADAAELAQSPPSTFSQLDYLLIHPLSGQGLPLSVEVWTGIVKQAGLTLLDIKPVNWTVLYSVRL